MNNTSLQEATYQTFLQKVVQIKQPGLCSLYPFPRTQEGKIIIREHVRYQCPADYAILAHDVTYCQYLTSDPPEWGGVSQQVTCLTALAKQLSDPSLCDSIQLSGSDRDLQADYISVCKYDAQATQ